MRYVPDYIYLVDGLRFPNALRHGAGRLISIVTNTTTTAQYWYNALGEQVQEYAPGAPSGYAYLQSYYDAFGNLAVRSSNGETTEDFFPAVAGRNYVKFAAGVTLFLHTGATGSSGIVTDENNGTWQDQEYFPFGMQWVPSGGGTDVRFGSMQEQDVPAPNLTGMYPTPARDYASYLGRWMTPDPLGGDITNPQSLNRYAYALNNPFSLTDPSGLITRYCPMADISDPCQQYLGYGEGGGSGGYTIDGQSVPNSVGQAVLSGGFGVACPANECGPVEVSNSSGQVAFAEFHPTLTNPLGYQQLTQWSPDPSLPQNEAYGLFSTAANQQNLNPSKAYTVNAYYQGLEMNIQVNGIPLDTSLLPLGACRTRSRLLTTATLRIFRSGHRSTPVTTSRISVGSCSTRMCSGR